MKKNRIYGRAFKIQAVLLSYRKGNIELVEKELGITPSLLNRWRQDYQKYGIGSFPGNGYLRLNAAQKRIYEIEKKINDSDLKLEILKKGSTSILQGRPMIFRFIQSHEKIYSIRKMCKALDVPIRSYHGWKSNPISETQNMRILIDKEITAIFFEMKQRYGAPRIAIELQNRGYKISAATAGRYMKKLGLYSKITKK
ncbi:IS3 family transposase [Flavobacterium mesophilum]|uniref:IS3 family transposase n=1 Tax=Flavobacterium mesophilum TaxID=3143495 RepID=UPI0031D9BC82